MSLASLDFFIFFSIAVTVYFIVPSFQLQWIWLLCANGYFYASWDPRNLVLFGVSSAVNYFLNLSIAQTPHQTRKKRLLILSLCCNLGLLVGFKYVNFFADSVKSVLGLAASPDRLALFLPIGISFYTFRVLSYTIDIYRGQAQPEKHFGIFAACLSFFPQIIAGPIEKPTHLLAQFHTRHRFDYANFASGARLIAWGLFKKWVIADRLVNYVNVVYQDPTQYRGWVLIAAVYAFALQIYCDFSGYSDIAIGLAKIMGFNLKSNFQRPYLSESPAYFWRRWHISLYTWFRDYLYIPLGGNRVSKGHWVFNILFVFLMSGLWHGADWTFVVWGLLQGIYTVGAIGLAGLTKKLRWPLQFTGLPPLIPKALRIFITFHLICFAWIFFRVDSISAALDIIKNIAVPSVLLSRVRAQYQIMRHVFGQAEFPIIPLSLVSLVLVEVLDEFTAIRVAFLRQPAWVRWGAYYLLVMALTLFAEFSIQQEFVYVRF